MRAADHTALCRALETRLHHASLWLRSRPPLPVHTTTTSLLALAFLLYLLLYLLLRPRPNTCASCCCRPCPARRTCELTYAFEILPRPITPQRRLLTDEALPSARTAHTAPRLRTDDRRPKTFERFATGSLNI